MTRGGHQVVTRAFGGGLAQNGRFHLDKALLVHIVAQQLDHLVPEKEHVLHAGTAQVQVAEFQAQALLLLGIVLNVDGRRLAGVEDDGGLRYDLYLTGLELLFTASGARIRALPCTSITYSLRRDSASSSSSLEISLPSNTTCTMPVRSRRPDEHDAAQVAWRAAPSP